MKVEKLINIADIDNHFQNFVKSDIMSKKKIADFKM